MQCVSGISILLPCRLLRRRQWLIVTLCDLCQTLVTNAQINIAVSSRGRLSLHRGDRVMREGLQVLAAVNIDSWRHLRESVTPFLDRFNDFSASSMRPHTLSSFQRAPVNCRVCMQLVSLSLTPGNQSTCGLDPQIIQSVSMSSADRFPASLIKEMNQCSLAFAQTLILAWSPTPTANACLECSSDKVQRLTTDVKYAAFCSAFRVIGRYSFIYSGKYLVCSMSLCTIADHFDLLTIGGPHTCCCWTLEHAGRGEIGTMIATMAIDLISTSTE